MEEGEESASGGWSAVSTTWVAGILAVGLPPRP